MTSQSSGDSGPVVCGVRILCNGFFVRFCEESMEEFDAFFLFPLRLRVSASLRLC